MTGNASEVRQDGLAATPADAKILLVCVPGAQTETSAALSESADTPGGPVLPRVRTQAHGHLRGARWGGDALGRGRAASDSPTCLLSLLVKEKVDGIAGSSGMQKEAPSRNKNTLRKPPGERNLVEQARHCSSPNSQKLRPLGKNPACVCVCVHVCVTVTE